MNTNNIQVTNKLQKRKIKIAQININKSYGNTCALLKYCQEVNTDFIMIQEPNIQGGKVRGFNNSTQTIYAQGQTKVATIVLNNNFQTLFLTQYSNQNIITIEINYGLQAFYNLNVYLPPERRQTEFDAILVNIQEIIKELQKTNRPILITGDINSKATQWGNKNTDKRGKEWNKIIEENQLIIINQGDVPTYESSRGSSYIDITLTNEKLYKKVINWKVEREEELLSDHNVITFEILLEKDNELNTNTRYNMKKANWEKFKTEVQQEIMSIVQDITIEEQKEEVNALVTKMHDKIKEITENNIPKVKTKRNTIHYWNEELEKQKQKCKKYRREYYNIIRQNNTPSEEIVQAKENLQNEKRSYRDQLKKARMQSWKKFCYEQSKEDPWGPAYRAITLKRQAQTTSQIKKQNGTLTKTIQETGKELMQYFNKKDNDKDDNEQHQKIREHKQNPNIKNTNIDAEISADEIDNIIKSMNPKKTPGPDKLNINIWKNIHKINADILTTIMMKCLKIGLFPTSWKTSELKIIQKPNKNDYTDPKSYRPLNMINVIGKIFEGVLVNKLEKHLEETNSLNQIQYGFTKKKSTIQAIQKVLKHIENSREHGNYTVLIALDIEGAFDHAWWPQILYEINEMNTPINLYRVIESYFQNRQIQLHYVNGTITETAQMGCPQGSKIAPLLWKILINDIEKLQDNEINITTFADDVAVVITNNTHKGIIEKTNKFLTKICNWTTNKKLRFNEKKTEIIFYGKLPNQTKPIFRMNNYRIHCSNKIKYLGITLTENLKWDIHINEVVEKTRKLTYKLKAACAETFGIDKKALLTIYNGAIRPAISYGAEIWAGKLTIKQRQKINSAPRTTLIGYTRSYKTTSNEALQIIAHSYPLDLYIQMLYNIGNRDENVNKKEKKIEEENTLKNKWQERWNTTQNGETTKRYIKTIEERNKINLNLNQQVTQLLTGHGNFKHYLKKIGKVESDLCEIDKVKDDVEHVLFRCTKYEMTRNIIDLKLKKCGLNFPKDWNALREITTEKEWNTELQNFAKAVPSNSQNEEQHPVEDQ